MLLGRGVSAEVPEIIGSRAQCFLVVSRTIKPGGGTSGLCALINLEDAGTISFCRPESNASRTPHPTARPRQGEAAAGGGACGVAGREKRQETVVT
jgi:hypothetical protein